MAEGVEETCNRTRVLVVKESVDKDDGDGDDDEIVNRRGDQLETTDRQTDSNSE